MTAQPVQYKVGDYVEIGKNRQGYIRFEGTVGPFGLCFGIELDSAIDTGNNGSFDGEQIFECEDGKGTFVKSTRIKQKLDPQKKSQMENEKKEGKKTEIKKKKTKKTSKKPKSKKGTKEDSKSKGKEKQKKKPKTTESKSQKKNKNKKTKTKGKGKVKGKRLSALPKHEIRKSGNLEEFTVPNDIEDMGKLQLIYPKLSNTKLGHKKRTEILQICKQIIEDEKCDIATAKYAIDGFKKVFTEQIKDQKFMIHKELYAILAIMITQYTKAYKTKNTYFLKYLMTRIGKLKANDKKQVAAIEKVILLMIKHIGVRDKKQLIVILSEFMRNATSSKNKLIKQKSWGYIYIALDTKQKKSGHKIQSNVLDSIEKGLKQSLSNTDRLVQEGSFKILNFFAANIGEKDRSEKLFGRMSASAQKQFHKKYPSSTPQWFSGDTKKLKAKPQRNRRLSVGQYNLEKNVGVKVKRDSLEKLNKPNKKSKKAKNKSKNPKTKESDVKSKYKNIKDKSGKKGKKNKGKGKTTKDKGKKNKSKDKKAAKSKGTKKGKNGELKKNSHQRSAKNLSTDQQNDSVGMGDLSDLLGGGDLFDALDLPLPQKEMGEEEEIEIENGALPHSNGGTHAHTNGGTNGGGAMSNGGQDSPVSPISSDEDDFEDFPYSFLMSDIRMNWKILEFLCADNKTNELMNALSRFKKERGINICTDKLAQIDYAQCIPDTLPLSSEDEDEISATQLSYNLMRLLSTDGSGDQTNTDAIGSYLLRQCQQILLHSLGVYHRDLSEGNVYHGRVLLEILLNTWPQSLMTALAKPSTDNVMSYNIELLFKNALFRSLHQGNLNSFFLDLVCYKCENAEKHAQILPHKNRLIQLFKKWNFMQYLLEDVSCSYKIGVNGNDDVQTKYATFFIDLVARSAAIQEVAPLFEGNEYLIIDSLMDALLDTEQGRTTWHRAFCGQILIQFMDICSRPTIMDPTQLLAAESGLIEPEPSPNILYPLFDKCLTRLHSYLPKLSKLVINYKSDFKSIQLNWTNIGKPFGQIRLHCLELLTISADFAQFECGNVLGKIPMDFWEYLIDMAFIHKNNNIFLCHFRRLIHLTMIFRRRILKHLFVEKKLLDRFIAFYVNKNNVQTALHGYILQMIYDIWQQDQTIDNEDDEPDYNNDSADDDHVENLVSQYL